MPPSLLKFNHFSKFNLHSAQIMKAFLLKTCSIFKIGALLAHQPLTDEKYANYVRILPTTQSESGVVSVGGLPVVVLSEEQVRIESIESVKPRSTYTVTFELG
uniref:AlNc14C448G11713 protein n=1 Tax=Albugo laibachii Nc14 TaxID=890382 RepID=F0WZX1_9STRA|nr:AlNc14C448G11713 [Albugo laibachii Nc14]|eukprot:CCA27051.1 AlNc14C448G11713 [Albugo laibachii Nc14]